MRLLVRRRKHNHGRAIAEYDDSGDLVWNYVYGLGQRMARFKGSDKQIYHNDHLGNVRAITDTSGAIVARVDYYPFGEELGLTGSPGRFTYNGNEFDDEYGFDLYYYGARYMDPALGRFTTPDPVKDFVNPYSYVRNNPMNAIDPTGMLVMRGFYLPPGVAMHHLTSVKDAIKDIIDAIFFDTNSKMEILEERLKDSYAEAKNMEASSATKEEKDHWAQIATAIDWIILNRAFAYGDLSTDTDNPYAQWNKETGVLTVDDSWFQESAVVQQGVLIHEAAHASHQFREGIYTERYSNIQPVPGYEHYTNEYINRKLTDYDSEEFAWEYTIKFFDNKYKDWKRYPNDEPYNWGYEKVEYSYTHGLQLTIERIFAHSRTYQQLYWIFGPDSPFR